MTNIVIGLDPLRTGTDPDFGVGTRAIGPSGKEYLYFKASAAVAAGDVVVIDETATTVAQSVTTTNGLRGRRIGVANAAIASGSYGWAQVYGANAAINVLASCVANVRLNTTATAGSPDDDGTATTKQIEGLYLTTTRGGTNGPAPGMLINPVIGVTL